MSFILQTSIVVRRLTTPITCQKSHNVRSYSPLLQSRQFQKISTSASYQNISECFINSIKSEEVNAICVVFVVSSQFSRKGMGKCVQYDWNPQYLICVIMSVNPRRRCVQCGQMEVDRRRVLFLAFRLISSTPSDSSCSASWDTFSQKRSLEWARLFSTALGDIQKGKNPKDQSSFDFLLRHNQTLGMSLKISAWHDFHGLLEKVRMSSSGFVSCFLCDSCNVDTVSLAHALHPKITSPPIWEFRLCLHSWHSQL